MSKKREELLEQIWAAQDTAYDLMSEYDSLPHSYGENVLYQAEAHLIDRIALHPGVTVTDLANMVRKTPSACSQLVRKLRDKGWVEQVRNAANNRQVMLRLTPAGEHVYRDHAAFDKDEVDAWKTRGPIHTFTARLKAEGQLDEAEFLALDAGVEDEVRQAVAFAESGEWEPVEDLLTDVHTNSGVTP